MTILHSFSCINDAKHSCNNALQPSPLRGSGCNTLSHSGLANVDTQKECFILLLLNGAETAMKTRAKRWSACFLNSFYMLKQELTCIPDLGLNADIEGQVLGPRSLVCLGMCEYV